MVHVARLDWIVQHLRLGRQVSVRVHSHIGKLNVHVCPYSDRSWGMQNKLAIDLITHIAHDFVFFTIVDHGR
eukprot:7403962-Pyramimonas_sp.AAC.1